jgi:hypothetical protein
MRKSADAIGGAEVIVVTRGPIIDAAEVRFGPGVHVFTLGQLKEYFSERQAGGSAA